MAPRKDVGLSPYEMLYGLPFLGQSSELLTMVSTTLLSLTPLLGFNIHSYSPEYYILIKAWKEKLQPTGEGPYQVILTTKTVICTAEKGWTHYFRIKSLSKNFWTITNPHNPPKVTLRQHEPTTAATPFYFCP
jgi:hypothetical protein